VHRAVDQLARAHPCPGRALRRAEVIICRDSALALVQCGMAGQPTEALDLAAQAVRKATEEALRGLPRSTLVSLLAQGLVDVRRKIDEALPAIVKSHQVPPETIGQTLRLAGYADVLPTPDRPWRQPARRRCGAGGVPSWTAIASSGLVLRLVRAGSRLLAMHRPAQGSICTRRIRIRQTAVGYRVLLRIRLPGQAGSAWCEAQVLEPGTGPRLHLTSLRDRNLTVSWRAPSMLVSDPANLPCAWSRGALAAETATGRECPFPSSAKRRRGNPTLHCRPRFGCTPEGCWASNISRLQDALLLIWISWARLPNAGRRITASCLGHRGQWTANHHSLDEALRDYTRLGSKRGHSAHKAAPRPTSAGCMLRRHWGNGETAALRVGKSLTEINRAGPCPPRSSQCPTNRSSLPGNISAPIAVAFHCRPGVPQTRHQVRASNCRIATQP